jgi:hypothetical protein
LIALIYVGWNAGLEFWLHFDGRMQLHRALSTYYLACEKYNVRPLKAA